MTTTVVVGAALGSACAAATSSVLQHRSARTTGGDRGDERRFLGRLLIRPMWLAGLLAGAVGLVLHALALSGGRLAVVQPLLVSGVLFALPVSVVLEGHRPSAVEGLWALLLVAGLAAFLVAGQPTAGSVSVDADVLAATTVVGCAVVGAIALVGLRWPHGHGSALLGTAAGIGYGVVAALLKQTSVLAEQGVVALLADWPAYTLIVVGGATIALTQLAYRAGPLAGSMPALTVTDPASSVAIGALAFHERLAATPLAITVEVAGFVAMFAATAQLARRNQQD